MVDLGLIAPLLEVLNTSVKGPFMNWVVSEHALIGPERGSWENPGGGISLKSDAGVVATIFLHGQGKDGFDQFGGPLPAGLTFEAGQGEVRRAFGEPASSDGPGGMPGVYLYGGWDRFEVGAYSIHFTYRADDGRIDLVTLNARKPANRSSKPKPPGGRRQDDGEEGAETSRLEMRAGLVGARDSRSLVRVRRTAEPGWSDGYVVNVGPEWLTLCRMADLMVFDGFAVFRFRDVSSVEAPAPNADFVERVLRLRRETRPRDPEIDLADIASVLRTASAAYPLLMVHRDVVDPDACHIGAVERIAGGSVVLRLISPNGEWHEERESFRLQDITRVDFGGIYEEALTLAASTD